MFSLKIVQNIALLFKRKFSFLSNTMYILLLLFVCSFVNLLESAREREGGGRQRDYLKQAPGSV